MYPDGQAEYAARVVCTGVLKGSGILGNDILRKQNHFYGCGTGMMQPTEDGIEDYNFADTAEKLYQERMDIYHTLNERTSGKWIW